MIGYDMVGLPPLDWGTFIASASPWASVKEEDEEEDEDEDEEENSALIFLSLAAPAPEDLWDEKDGEERDGEEGDRKGV